MALSTSQAAITDFFLQVLKSIAIFVDKCKNEER